MGPKRVDVNQAEIVVALRAVGAGVQHLHTVGCGCPDLLVIYRHRLFLLEVKTKNGDLTRDERVWHERYPGIAHIVRSIDEALDAIGAERYTVDEILPPRRPVRLRRGG